MTKFACPNCGCTLKSGLAISCAVCGKVGERIDGIPCFADPQYYWGEIPLTQMQRVNEHALASGWRHAVDKLVKSELHKYICSPTRADFQHIWDVSHDAEVLDVGAGWGAIACSLGQNVGNVVAMEGVLERCRFIQTRAQQCGIGNLSVICADFQKPPLAGSQFDVIVLNGVVEWAGMVGKENPRDLQLRFLRKMHHLLKPGGILCVGIENRIGVQMFRGAKDHSGLRYTSLMPRSVADVCCRYRQKAYRSGANSAYRTYTYSLPGYRKLFREAGFVSTVAFHAWNGYNDPSILLPLHGPEPLVHFASGQRAKRTDVHARLRQVAMTIAAKTGIWAQLASDFIFLVQKS